MRLIIPNSIEGECVPAILTNTINPVHIAPIGDETMSLDTALPDDVASLDSANARYRLTHLKHLESEAIHIMREVVMNFSKPVMLFSVGKDSMVMLHLARKAFHPSPLPFPLLHVNTTWKFKEMIRFRDQLCEDWGLKLYSHTNPDGLDNKITPFTHGSSKYTHLMKTVALKQALDEHGFDAAFGGARRDEEKAAPKSGYTLSAIPCTNGTLKTNVPNCGISTTARWTRANPSACSPLQLDRARRLAVHPLGKNPRAQTCTLQPSAPVLNAMARSSVSTTSASPCAPMKGPRCTAFASAPLAATHSPAR